MTGHFVFGATTLSILRIYFSGNWRDNTSVCPWALCDEAGSVLQSGNDTLGSMPKGHDAIGIVAPDRVLSVAARVPPGPRRRWQASLPFVAEEYTLPDPEDNHVVPGPVLNDGRVMLAVVDKAWLARIVEACRTANLSLRRMIPETFLPPITADAWTLVWDGQNGFVRTGAASGANADTCGADSAPLALRLILKAALPAIPARIEIRFPHHVPEDQRILPHWPDLPIPLFAGPPWDWRRAPVPADALNLLWGNFAPRIKLGEWWPKLRPAVLILLAALGVETAGANIEWAMLANEKSALMQDMEHSFRSAFGESGTLVNAPLQMQRNLAKLRHDAGLPDDGDFLSLLDTASGTFVALPAGSVRGLHYESGRLDVDIKLAHGNDFQSLRQRLQLKGLKVQMADAHDVGDGAESRLTLLPGDGS
jgi:general secretion pathway protein L